MTGVGVSGTIAADADNGLIEGNPLEHSQQHRRIAGSVVGRFDRKPRTFQDLLYFLNFFSITFVWRKHLCG